MCVAYRELTSTDDAPYDVHQRYLSEARLLADSTELEQRTHELSRVIGRGGYKLKILKPFGGKEISVILEHESGVVDDGSDRLLDVVTRGIGELLHLFRTKTQALHVLVEFAGGVVCRGDVASTEQECCVAKAE